ncbi:MAG: hemerythrin domain-containing protein, partial [Proteobacteria bacterium]|nr:hemerythrin domain-containing protein [Pseudomonadota bacterium]
FKREEKVMQACGFPHIETHQREHRDFTKRIQDIHVRYHREADVAMTRDLLDFLKDWLNHHILIQDMAYKPYVAGDRKVRRVARSFGPGLADTGAGAGPFKPEHAAHTAG